MTPDAIKSAIELAIQGNGRTADQFVGWIRSDSAYPPQTER
jgi:hypothetical protein